MQFKHPEILYFLFFLTVPILVHLFQLQRFVKVPFTNVAFLQKLVLQTRKSSRIKKWLILSTRLLLLTALIFAFAQPYFSNHQIDKKQQLFIFLDNSLSTNAIGEKGNLLQVASQEIIENLSDKAIYTLATHDNFYRNKTASEVKNILLKITNTAKNSSLENAFLKFKSDPNTKNATTLFISDFQNVSKNVLKNIKTDKTTLVQITPQQKSNISIDSVFVTDNGSSNFDIHITVKNQGKELKNIPIAIYNTDKLVNKQTFSATENNTQQIVFSIVKTPQFLGKIVIDFNDTYTFDNTFYFSLNTAEKTNVLSIGTSADFLNRIYTEKEFNFKQTTQQNVDFNSIPKQHLIILNEIKNISNNLINSLHTFAKNGGNIVIIPNKEATTSSYKSLFNKLTIGEIQSQKNDSLKITTINYNHPLLKNVFEKKVRNFQYPFVTTTFNSALKNASTIVSFENKKGFIQKVNLANSSVFWVASPLKKQFSNFTNSPLIVPVFYNIGKQSLQLSKLYYTIDKQNIITIDKQLGKDEIVTIASANTSFIPLQQTFQNKVQITTKDQPLIADFYQINQQENSLKNIAFNYSKNESLLNFTDFEELKNTSVSSSVKNTLQNINDTSKIQWLWKWFLIAAIVSLLLEIFILKFFKT